MCTLWVLLRRIPTERNEFQGLLIWSLPQKSADPDSDRHHSSERSVCSVGREKLKYIETYSKLLEKLFYKMYYSTVTVVAAIYCM
jgi:hypothetical protein